MTYPTVSEEQYVEWLDKLTKMREEFLELYCEVMNSHPNKAVEKFRQAADKVDDDLFSAKLRLLYRAEEVHDKHLV